MTVLVKGLSKEDAIKGVAMRFGSTEEWARALVATFVEFGLLKFDRFECEPSTITDPVHTGAVCGYPEPQSFREIKQEIKNGV